MSNQLNLTVKSYRNEEDARYARHIKRLSQASYAERKKDMYIMQDQMKNSRRGTDYFRERYRALLRIAMGLKSPFQLIHDLDRAADEVFERPKIIKSTSWLWPDPVKRYFKTRSTPYTLRIEDLHRKNAFTLSEFRKILQHMDQADGRTMVLMFLEKIKSKEVLPFFEKYLESDFEKIYQIVQDYSQGSWLTVDSLLAQLEPDSNSEVLVSQEEELQASLSEDNHLELTAVNPTDQIPMPDLDLNSLDTKADEIRDTQQEFIDGSEPALTPEKEYAQALLQTLRDTGFADLNEQFEKVTQKFGPQNRHLVFTALIAEFADEASGEQARLGQALQDYLAPENSQPHEQQKKSPEATATSFEALEEELKKLPLEGLNKIIPQTTLNETNQKTTELPFTEADPGHSEFWDSVIPSQTGSTSGIMKRAGSGEGAYRGNYTRAAGQEEPDQSHTNLNTEASDEVMQEPAAVAPETEDTSTPYTDFSEAISEPVDSSPGMSQDDQESISGGESNLTSETEPNRFDIKKAPDTEETVSPRDLRDLEELKPGEHPDLGALQGLGTASARTTRTDQPDKSFEIAAEQADSHQENTFSGENAFSEESDSFQARLMNEMEEVNKIRERLELEQKLPARLLQVEEQKDEDEAVRILAELHPEAFQASREFVLRNLEEFGSPLGKIMGHLSEMSRRLSIPDMKLYVDYYIQQLEAEGLFEEYPNIKPRLENYRASLVEPPPELLKQVHMGLQAIEDEFKNSHRQCVEKQLDYLKERLSDETFEKVWPTILTIYENLVKSELEAIEQKKLIENPLWKRRLKQEFETTPRTLSEILEEVGNGHHASITDILNNFKKDSLNPSFQNEEPLNTQNIRNLFANQNGKSAQENAQMIQDQLKKLFEDFPEDALEISEIVLNSHESSLIEKEAVLELLGQPELGENAGKIYHFHLSTDQAGNPKKQIEHAQAFRGIVSDESIENKISAIREAHAQHQARSTVHQFNRASTRDQKIALFGKIKDNPRIPQDFKRIYSKNAGDDVFEKAMEAITISGNPNQTKMELLILLKDKAKQKEWLTPGRQTKIDYKIRFYKNIIEGDKAQARNYLARDSFYRNYGSSVLDHLNQGKTPEDILKLQKNYTQHYDHTQEIVNLIEGLDPQEDLPTIQDLMKRIPPNFRKKAGQIIHKKSGLIEEQIEKMEKAPKKEGRFNDLLLEKLLKNKFMASRWYGRLSIADKEAFHEQTQQPGKAKDLLIMIETEIAFKKALRELKTNPTESLIQQISTQFPEEDYQKHLEVFRKQVLAPTSPSTTPLPQTDAASPGMNTPSSVHSNPTRPQSALERAAAESEAALGIDLSFLDTTLDLEAMPAIENIPIPEAKEPKTVPAEPTTPPAGNQRGRAPSSTAPTQKPDASQPRQPAKPAAPAKGAIDGIADTLGGALGKLIPPKRKGAEKKAPPDKKAAPKNKDQFSPGTILNQTLTRNFRKKVSLSWDEVEEAAKEAIGEVVKRNKNLNEEKATENIYKLLEQQGILVRFPKSKNPIKPLCFLTANLKNRDLRQAERNKYLKIADDENLHPKERQYYYDVADFLLKYR